MASQPETAAVAGGQPGDRLPGPADRADDRETLGRIVHEQRLAFNAELAHPRGVLPWEQRDPGQQEMDMRIGSAVAARAVADAKLEAAAIRKQLVAFSIHMPALRRALAVAITESDYEAEAGPYRAALRVLGGEEECHG
jgi:hypothetical protein